MKNFQSVPVMLASNKVTAHQALREGMTWIFPDTLTRKQTHTYTHAQTHSDTHLRLRTHTNTHTYTHACIHACTHRHTHTNTHIQYMAKDKN